VHLAVAGIPLLAISADVLGLVPVQTVAIWVLLAVLATVWSLTRTRRTAWC
jgi:hypothetical protein